MDKKKTNIEELSTEFEDHNSSLEGSPQELTAAQRLTRFMSIILLALFGLLVIASLAHWDGKTDGPYADLWEYTKLIGTTIIGGVVATYLQPNNNDN